MLFAQYGRSFNIHHPRQSFNQHPTHAVLDSRVNTSASGPAGMLTPVTQPDLPRSFQ